MADAFITLTDLSEYLGRDLSGDAGATLALEGACGAVRTLTGQEITQGTSTVVLDGPGTDALVLPQLPVSSVGTVELVDTSGTTAITDYVLADHGVLFRTAGAVDGWPSSCGWPAGRQNVRVSYVHGYGTADIPAELKMTATAIASRLIVQGVASEEAQGQVSVRYGTNATDFTAGERAILHKYRQIG